MEAFELLPWPLQLGLIGGLIVVIISLVVRRERAISRGDLVPKATHEEALRRSDQRAEDYKRLWEVSDRRGDVMESVAKDIVVIGENINHLIKDLPRTGVKP